MDPLSSAEIVKNRWLGFLIWQSIVSTSVYLLTSPFVNSPFGFFPSLSSLLSFLTFHLSVLLFSLSLFLISSPHPDPSAPLPELAAGLVRVFLRSLVGFEGSWDSNFRRRAGKTLMFVLFLLICALSGFLSAVSVCGDLEVLNGWRLVGLGLRGSVFGLVYGAYFLYKKRWILRFPTIQRPFFFSFKMGLSRSFEEALKLSTTSVVCSTVMMVFLPDYLKRKSTLVETIIEVIRFYIGISAVSFCWELSHHLLQVVHTRRCSFAPPQGSAAAETNPSETLLEALEQSTRRSLFQYLTHLDLVMVSESNVEPWRRAAFFEETGKTYSRIVSACLRPIEELTSRLDEGLEGITADKSELLSLQLNPVTNNHINSSLHQAFDDFQVCTWSARTVAALTARSHSEDRFGVAQLTGCNVAVVSKLLSCLVVVEAYMGKKTKPQPAHLMGPASIRWATGYTGKRDGVAAVTSKTNGTPLHGKAYAMADVLRTSIYQIVSAFEADMLANSKSSVLEKNWIAEGKPLHSTRDVLVHKLHTFLEFRAC